ncbi:hypothetical protein E8E12_011739 [Didymella heteroderae]|uniref:Subtilisin-like serine protease n=1 Tax=Didymella heteroderae TaxID=1769908 RepID=A0A9P4X333_9PLEO|nr:hypothetical protein E8E12_011739 [Didymella heteroderae]
MAQAVQITAATPPDAVATFSRSSTAAEELWTGRRVPFAKCDELCSDLEYLQEPEKPHFFRNRTTDRTLPDAPRIHLDALSSVVHYCLKDLDTPQLNHLGDKLWWAGPSPEIVSLSQQLVLDRTIRITEDPEVHCLWAEGIVYLKPIPAYLTSHAFWEYLCERVAGDDGPEERERLRATSLGFLRTYARLIQRRSDFNLARRHDLLPTYKSGNMTFEAFVAFISAFDSVSDKAVSSRWRYGLLQLDALNFHSVIHLRRWHLNRFESRYAVYFQRFFPVVLFIFALFSVALSAMQVILGAKQLWDTDNKGLKKILGLFVWFATESIGWSIAFGLLFVVWWICISSVEVWKRRKTMKRMQKASKEDRTVPP